MTDRYRQALEGLRERCAQEAERITARRRAVAAMSNNEAVKPCGVAAAIRKIDVQQYCECAVREIERLRTENERLREDAERLDWLDSMNAKLNSHYGTTYRWKLVLSPNVVRLMSGAGGNGHVAAIDLHDSEAHGALSCREAIDHARRAEGGGE